MENSTQNIYSYYFYNRNVFVCLAGVARVRSSIGLFRFIRTYIVPVRPNRFITNMRLRHDYQTPDTLCSDENPKTNKREMEKRRKKKKRDVKPKAPHVQFASIFMFISSSEWAFSGCRSWRFHIFRAFFDLLIHSSMARKRIESSGFIIFIEFIVVVLAQTVLPFDGAAI